jgi:PAS domain S-box-containing protein
MKDSSKTKQELIAELSVLKKKITNMEKSESESKKAELTMQKSEEHYRILVENASDIIFRTDNTGHHIFVNPAALRMTGYKEEEIIGMHYTSLIRTDMRDEAVKFFGRQFVKKINNTYSEYPIIRKDGHELWFGQNTQLMVEDGNVTGFQSIARDITDRKQVEEALKESSGRYKELSTLLESLFDAIPDVLGIQDNQHGIIRYNKAGYDFIGRTQQEVEGKKCFQLINKTKPCDICATSEVYRTKKPAKVEKCIEDMGVRLDCRSYPVFDDKGNISKIIEHLRDITELKNAENELRKSEEMLRLITDNMSDMIRVTDLQGANLYTSPSHFKSLGYRPEERIGKSAFDIVHPDDLERIINIFSEGLVANRPVNIEYRVKHADGHYVWLETVGNLLRDAQGNITSVVMSSRDITERKQAEMMRQEQENKLSSIFRAAPVGIGMVINRVFQECNDTLCLMTGYYREELLGKNARILYTTDEDYEYVGKEKYRQISKNRIGTVETRWKKKNGTVIDIILSSTPLDPDDLSQGVTFTALDITERKQAEGALKKSEDNYRMLATYHKQLNDISIELTEASGTEDLFNRIAESLRLLTNAIATTFSVYNQETNTLKVVSLSTDPTSRGIVSSIFGPELFEMRVPVSADVLVDMLSQGIRRPKDLCELSFGIMPQEISVAVMDAVGCRQIVALAISYDEELIGTCIAYLSGDQPVVPDNALKTYMYLSAVAIKRMQAEEDKRLLQERLQHADKMDAIGTLAGGIAHDFNNMLMGIQGNASLSLKDIDSAHPNYDNLKRIEQQVQSGAALTKQLLGFARGGKYEVKPTDMNEVIEKISSLFGRTKKEISIQRKHSKDLWSVEVDRGQMEQVFLNLYVNAWQAMPGGGDIYVETQNILLDEAQALSFSAKPGKYVKIAVTDTGTGMDEKTKARIFEPFFTTKGMGRGTGLGLATVYGIIKGHHGIINVYSEPGHGTTFTVYLPASEKEVVKEKTATRKIVRGKETILLVDDEKMVMEVSKKMLESLGYKVYVAGSGQEAIAVYMEKGNKIDLVILDMIMPGISGGGTFDRLMEINPQIKILLSSGYSLNGQARDIMDRGCKGFLQKPFLLSQFSGKIREILD